MYGKHDIYDCYQSLLRKSKKTYISMCIHVTDYNLKPSFEKVRKKGEKLNCNFKQLIISVLKIYASYNVYILSGNFCLLNLCNEYESLICSWLIQIFFAIYQSSIIQHDSSSSKMFRMSALDFVLKSWRRTIDSEYINYSSISMLFIQESLLSYSLHASDNCCSW